MASIRMVHTMCTVAASDRSLMELRMDGWTVVQRVDPEFDVGMNVVFCEIGSFVPSSLVELEPVTELHGVRGTRVWPREIHGVVSQGIIIPLTLPQTAGLRSLPVGTDVSEMLGIRRLLSAEEAAQ
jgi:hypothetical protein